MTDNFTAHECTVTDSLLRDLSKDQEIKKYANTLDHDAPI